jgi:CDP-glycerol glycerophosphotransferase (TagB/SpsB family)
MRARLGRVVHRNHEDLSKNADAPDAFKYERRDFLEQVAWFDSDWYLTKYPEAGEHARGAIGHYLEQGCKAGSGPNEDIDSMANVDAVPTGFDEAVYSNAHTLAAEMRLVSTTESFDADYYLENNPDVRARGLDPLLHFCRHGWRELRRPNPDFDVWWYWTKYLNPSRQALNPLVHYALVGGAAGFRGAPGPPHLREGHSYQEGQRIRRICLFAGYDQHGIIDDYVVEYVRELSRHADVYYLADCHMDADELEKLAAFTKGRWGVRHGAYDFGSYSLLARDLVGWDLIDSYDELVLANDSSYLLRDLDQMFATMDAKDCDWWGVQATKGLAKTRHVASNRFSTKIPMERVRGELLQEYESDYLYDFHMASYFLVYRRPVTEDWGFRRLLNSVTPGNSKLQVIQKYEIGFTRFLIGHGYSFAAYIDDLYPFHPIFTETAFDLISQGFPFLKRYFLSDNHYDVPDLARWKDRVLDLVPDAPVEIFERNLLRVAGDDKLQRSFAVVRAEDGTVAAPAPLLRGDEFCEEDRWTPKFDHWWAFPVCAYDHTFSGNERAVFEEVRNDPSVKKIVLTRSRAINVDGENVVVVPLLSAEGQQYLLRARQIFIKHTPTRNAVFPLSPEWHNFINVWHGIPLKRFGYASLDTVGIRKALGAEHRRCRAVIASSRIDTLAMAAAFYPLTYEEMWTTGLPRNDFILRSFERLPADLQEQEVRLREMTGGRRLVLFVPTFKNGQADAYYEFSDVELKWLDAWLERNGAVLGVREHMADTARTYSTMLTSLGALDLSSREFPDVEMLYRSAAALVTDYSSCVVDFMLTGRPVVSFAYDYDNYANSERGLFYDLEHALPGPICRDFEAFSEALEHLFETPDERATQMYDWKRQLFFDHVDDQNAWRVVQRVKQLYGHTGPDR